MPTPPLSYTPAASSGSHRSIILVIFCVLFIWICVWLFGEMMYLQRVRRKLMVSVDPKETFYDSMLCYAYPLHVLAVKTLAPNVLECDSTDFLKRIAERIQAKNNQYLANPLLRPCIHIHGKMRFFNIQITPTNLFIQLTPTEIGDAAPFSLVNDTSNILEAGWYWCMFFFP